MSGLGSLVARVVAYKCFVVRGSDLIGIFRHTRMEISFGLRSFIVGPKIYSQWKIYDYLVIIFQALFTKMSPCRWQESWSESLMVSWLGFAPELWSEWGWAEPRQYPNCYNENICVKYIMGDMCKCKIQNTKSSSLKLFLEILILCNTYNHWNYGKSSEVTAKVC